MLSIHYKKFTMIIVTFVPHIHTDGIDEQFSYPWFIYNCSYYFVHASIKAYCIQTYKYTKYVY